MTDRSVVVAGPLAFYAKPKGGRAFGQARATAAEAFDDMAAADAVFDTCPPRQWGAAAQAAMAILWSRR